MKEIRIINPKQAAFYVYRGAELLKVEQDFDRRNGEPLFLFLFDYEKTQSFYKEWCERK